jgi:hypothetical protein
VVINEQTREEWCAGSAAIENGRLVVACSRNHSAPTRILTGASTTYTITAADGGNRFRRFSNLTLDPSASKPPKRYVFT